MRKIPEKYRQWFLQELPILEDKGILSAESRQPLEDYYSNQVESRVHWAAIVCAVLGALLIGGGIILLFAHNWDDLSRTARAVLSFCPLAIGVALSALAIRRGGTGLCESAGIFHSLAVGACIALIGQTYHLPSNTPGFLLIWALLILPLIFLLPSTGAYLFYITLICSWSDAAQDEYGQALGFWLLLIPAVVHVVRLIRREAHEGLLSLWGLMLMLSIALGIVLERTVPGLWIVAYACFLSLSGLLGLRLFPTESGWRNPLQTVGLAGITVLAYIFTWKGVWHDIGWSNTRHYGNYQEWGIWCDSALTLGLAIVWALTAVKTLRRNSLPKLILCSFPLFASAGFFFAASSGSELINTLLFNAYMLALGLAYLAQGCRSTQLRQVNYGMAVLGLLLITRFFDSDFGFLARGLAFILIGSCFLATNLIMTRKKHQLGGAQS
jgi:uncharacterized membrane protein